MQLISLGMESQFSLITLISCEIELDQQGQQPKRSQNRTTPRDQISALEVQIYYFRISGAMQIGEPNMVCAMLTYNILQKPKSPSLTLLLLRKILSGLRSLCMILFLLSSLNAYSSCLNIISAQFYLRNFFFCMRFSIVPSLQYSQTKQKLFGVFNVQMKRTMCQWRREERMLISLMASCSSLGLERKEALGMTFTANTYLLFWCTARYTCPQTPLPMGY